MMFPIRHKMRSHRRSAVVAVQVGVVMIVLLGFAALAVDVGYVFDMHGAMQAAVDSSSLSGAAALVNGQGAAKAEAKEYAGKNYVSRTALAPNEVTVITGLWEGLTDTFIPLPDGTSQIPNAVRVIGQRENISLLFANVFGRADTDISRRATAIQGAGKCLGIWGLEGITADGDIITDSFDYRVGAYGGNNIRPNGDICSCTGIELNGGVSIRGDAIYGEDYSLDIFGNSYEIWGLVDDQNCTFPVPTIDMIQASLVNDNLTIGLTTKGNDPFDGDPWNLYVTGNDSLTLAPGTYYFDSLLIDGQAWLGISGPTELYVAGDVIATGGGILNPTQIPENLKIYSTGTLCQITGGAGFHGAVIAPDSTIEFFGTSDIFGVVMGRTLDFDGNARIHVEESLVADLFGVEAIAPVLVE